MTLTKRGNYYYSESQVDIRDELSRYSKLNEYMTDQYADSSCTCGSCVFHLFTDDDTGVAVRKCTSCGVEHVMADGAEYLSEADLYSRECICGEGSFEITSGVSLYSSEDGKLTDDVRWLYIGCRCVSCGLTGCYSDWKNEYNGYKSLLANM